VRQSSPGGVDASTAPNSAQIVQVETLGRLGLLMILVMFVALVGLGVVAGYSLGVGEARAESIATQVRQLNARVEVIQWEFDKASAQLLDKGLITAAE
jgi:outer membrane murein-binding lipoprotein Lpp